MSQSDPSSLPSPDRGQTRPRTSLDLLRLARRLVRPYRIPGHDRDDLVQECLVAMLTIEAPDLPEGHLVWAARRRLTALVRRARARPDAGPLTQTPVDHRPLPEVQVMAREEFERLLDHLTERQALVLDLGCSMSDEEVAVTLMITESAVRVHRCEGLRRLRELAAQKKISRPS